MVQKGGRRGHAGRQPRHARHRGRLQPARVLQPPLRHEIQRPAHRARREGPAQHQGLVPRQRDGRPVADRPQDGGRVRPPRRRDREGDEADRPVDRARALRQLEHRHADLPRVGEHRARLGVQQRRLHLAAPVLRQPLQRHREFPRAERRHGPLHQNGRRHLRLREGQEAREEEHQPELRRMERVVPRQRGRRRHDAEPPVADRAACSRTITTSRTRCSSA